MAGLALLARDMGPASKSVDRDSRGRWRRSQPQFRRISSRPKTVPGVQVPVPALPGCDSSGHCRLSRLRPAPLAAWRFQGGDQTSDHTFLQLGARRPIRRLYAPAGCQTATRHLKGPNITIDSIRSWLLNAPFYTLLSRAPPGASPHITQFRCASFLNLPVRLQLSFPHARFEPQLWTHTVG